MAEPVTVASFLPKFQLGKFDAEKFGLQLADIIQNSVEGLIDGAQEDLALYANRMADDAVRIMAIQDVEKREKLLQELAMQVQLIGEINRLRATQAAWHTASKVFLTVVKTAIRFVVPIP